MYDSTSREMTYLTDAQLVSSNRIAFWVSFCFIDQRVQGSAPHLGFHAGNDVSDFQVNAQVETTNDIVIKILAL
jgi:hypothetical protein